MGKIDLTQGKKVIIREERGNLTVILNASSWERVIFRNRNA